MKPTACLVNAARGGLIDETALIEALREGLIRAAALDVFEQEPPLCDSPLFSLSNVLLSPHNAALTDRALVAMAEHSAQGIVQVLSGQMPTHLVNPDVKTRMI
jgi:D-3-phosphoglycerate dehydrogenase